MVAILDPLVIDDTALLELIILIKQRTLPCLNQIDVKGDYRFWGVDPMLPIIRQFQEAALNQYAKQTGDQPRHVIIMANHISARASPEGSGGGWHVDSVRSQFKLFMYLTDCTREELGPLTLLSLHPLIDRAVIFLNYLLGNKFRFTEARIELLCKLGFRPKPVLAPCLEPFFVNTSFIHRGAPITQGERIMITAYLFPEEIPESVAKRTLADEYR